MASPGSFAAGGVLTAAEMNALPAGLLDSTAAPDTTITSSGVDVDSITFTLPSTRKVLVIVEVGRVDSISTALNLENRIYTGPSATGSRLLVNQRALPSSGLEAVNFSAVLTLGAGTFTLYWNATTNTGTCVFNEGFNRVNQFSAIDVGA